MTFYLFFSMFESSTLGFEMSLDPTPSAQSPSLRWMPRGTKSWPSSPALGSWCPEAGPLPLVTRGHDYGLMVGFFSNAYAPFGILLSLGYFQDEPPVSDQEEGRFYPPPPSSYSIFWGGLNF